MNKLLLYYHTIKYLKFRQIFYRLYYKIYRPKVCKSLKGKDICIRKLPSKHLLKTFVKKCRIFFYDDKIFLLNQEYDLNQKELWNSPTQNKLWLYNLHYFDALLSSCEVQVQYAYKLLIRWADENPLFKGIAWEPYPVSLRIVNVVKYLLMGHELPSYLLKLLYLQARFLCRNLEYYLLGNHLFENIKALCFAGLYFDSDEASAWFSQAYGLLKEQIKEQILYDGGHFELSPMYHNLVLEGLLDLKNIFAAYNISFYWDNEIIQMINWMRAMQRSDTEISYFNDAANAIAPTPSALMDYAKSLGFRYCNEQDEKTILNGSGYYVLQKGRAKLIADIATLGVDYLPGHAHADTLSFELYIDDFPVFTNLGTSCYGLSKRREFERSTAAHNTVVVNSKDSSEVWSGFRVARRAKIKYVKNQFTDERILLQGAHNGYERLHKSTLHERTWDFGLDELIIRDRVLGHYDYFVIYLHLHPRCSIIECEQQSMRIKFSTHCYLTLKFDTDYKIIRSSYAQEFGLLKATNSIVIRPRAGINTVNLSMKW